MDRLDRLAIAASQAVVNLPDFEKDLRVIVLITRDLHDGSVEATGTSINYTEGSERLVLVDLMGHLKAAFDDAGIPVNFATEEQMGKML